MGRWDLDTMLSEDELLRGYGLELGPSDRTVLADPDGDAAAEQAESIQSDRSCRQGDAA